MAWHEPNLESPVDCVETCTFSKFIGVFLLTVIPVITVFCIDIIGGFGSVDPTEHAMLYLAGIFFSLLMAGCELYLTEINQSAYHVWRYWQLNEIYYWIIPKHIPLYLSASAIVSNNPFVIEHINGDKPLPRDEDLPALIPNSETVIAGNDRLILLFSTLLEKLSASSVQDKSVSHIFVNTAVELDEFTHSALKRILSASRYAHFQQLSFCCQPDYNQQIEDIKSQNELALIFTLLHYSTESQEENEMGSVSLLSPHYDANAVGLFPAMPFSMENYQEDIDQLLRVQQQPNTALKLLCISKSQLIEPGKVHQSLGQKELNLLSESVHSGTLNFHEIAGEHDDLSVFLLLASLSLSQYQQDSMLIFYRVNESTYCQSIGKQPSGREVAPPDIPAFIFPAGSLISGFAALSGALLVGMLLQWHVDHIILLTIVAVGALLVVSLVLMTINLIWTNRRWWPVFVSRRR